MILLRYRVGSFVKRETVAKKTIESLEKQLQGGWFLAKLQHTIVVYASENDLLMCVIFQAFKICWQNKKLYFVVDLVDQKWLAGNCTHL